MSAIRNDGLRVPHVEARCEIGGRRLGAAFDAQGHWVWCRRHAAYHFWTWEELAEALRPLGIEVRRSD